MRLSLSSLTLPSRFVAARMPVASSSRCRPRACRSPRFPANGKYAVGSIPCDHPLIASESACTHAAPGVRIGAAAPHMAAGR